MAWVVASLVAAYGWAQPKSFELNTALMQVTFEIYGPQKSKPERTSFGTVFLVGRPMKADPQRSYIVLVTAAHVLDDIGGDTAFLLLRRKQADGTYTPFSFAIKINNQGKPRYIKHDSADVAVMYVSLPSDIDILLPPMELLVDDKRLEQIELHPGDEALCLGFPLFASGPGGFPILRSGKLASYPLIPAKVVKEYLYDVLLYSGNSGGPVYFSFANRVFAGATNIGVQQGILGLIIEQENSNLPEFADKPLNLGVIVPAEFIRDTIGKLPTLEGN